MIFTRYIQLFLLLFNKHFFISLALVCLLLSAASWLGGSDVIGILAMVCVVLYVFLAGRGKYICFFFGISYSLLYGYIAYLQNLYGEVMLNALYIPINLAGIILWKSNQRQDKSAIIIRHANRQVLIACIAISALASIGYGIFLDSIQAKFAYLNATSVVVQVVAFYLQVQRYVENYAFVTFANIISMGLWLAIMNDISMEYIAQFLSYAVLFVLGVIYWIEWGKQAKVNYDKRVDLHG